MFKQYQYSPSSNTPVIQQWFLEFLYPNIGAEYYYVSASKKIISMKYIWNTYPQNKILTLL